MEPIQIPVDEPTLIKDAMRLYKGELGYSRADLQNLMLIGDYDYAGLRRGGTGWCCASSSISAHK